MPLSTTCGCRGGYRPTGDRRSPLRTKTIHLVRANCVSPVNEGEDIMDFYKVPIGFGMALAMNQTAMNACAAMAEDQK